MLTSGSGVKQSLLMGVSIRACVLLPQQAAMEAKVRQVPMKAVLTAGAITLRVRHLVGPGDGAASNPQGMGSIPPAVQQEKGLGRTGTMCQLQMQRYAPCNLSDEFKAGLCMLSMPTCHAGELAHCPLLACIKCCTAVYDIDHCCCLIPMSASYAAVISMDLLEAARSDSDLEILCQTCTVTGW